MLGGTHPEEGAAILAGAGVRYCPFPGTVEGHPSVLSGDDRGDRRRRRAADRARRRPRPGPAGLPPRDADPVALTRAVAEAADGPVIAAGSVATLEQIAALEGAGAWGFTIGGAIFERRLPGGPTVAGQVAAVLAAAGGAEVGS